MSVFCFVFSKHFYYADTSLTRFRSSNPSCESRRAPINLVVSWKRLRSLRGGLEKLFCVWQTSSELSGLLSQSILSGNVRGNEETIRRRETFVAKQNHTFCFLLQTCSFILNRKGRKPCRPRHLYMQR